MLDFDDFEEIIMNKGTNRTIGERIAHMRKMKDKTQSEMAKDLNLTRNTISKWEANIQEIKSHDIIALAEYFGVSCDEILTGNRPEHMELMPLGLTSESIDNLQRMYRCAKGNFTEKETAFYKPYYEWYEERNEQKITNIYDPVCSSYKAAIEIINFILGQPDCEYALYQLENFAHELMFNINLDHEAMLKESLIAAGVNPFEAHKVPKYTKLFIFADYLEVWAKREPIMYKARDLFLKE